MTLQPSHYLAYPGDHRRIVGRVLGPGLNGLPCPPTTTRPPVEPWSARSAWTPRRRSSRSLGDITAVDWAATPAHRPTRAGAGPVTAAEQMHRTATGGTE